MTRQRWLISSLCCVLLLGGASAWLYISMTEGMVKALRGIFAAIGKIQDAPSGESATDAKTALSIIPREALDVINQYSRWLGFVVIVPGLLSALLFGLAIIMFVRAAHEGAHCAAVLSRGFIVTFDVVAIIAFAMFLVCGALGIVVNQPFFKGQVESITSTCSVTLPQLQDMASQLNTAVKAGQTSLQTQLNEAQQAVKAFDDLCDNVTLLFDNVRALTIPGFVGAGIILVSIVTGNLGCCAVTNDGSTEKDFTGVSIATHDV